MPFSMAFLRKQHEMLLHIMVVGQECGGLELMLQGVGIIAFGEIDLGQRVAVGAVLALQIERTLREPQGFLKVALGVRR